MTDLLLDAIRETVREVLREEIAKISPPTPAVDSDLPEFLTTKEAAVLLRVDPSTLSRMRDRGDGPPFHTVGRSVRYRRTDVLNHK